MAADVRIPRLGWSMELGTFLGWLKRDGEPVKEGDPLYELEGEKATQEIESIDEGYLRIPPDAPAPGTELPVGALLAYITESPSETPWDDKTETHESFAVGFAPSQNGTRSTGAGASPSVRRRALELGVSINEVIGSGRKGRITREDVDNHANPGDAFMSPSAQDPVVNVSSPSGVTNKKRSSPRARRIADELQIDWTKLQGTGKGGRIREADVRQAATAQREMGTSPRPTVEFAARKATLQRRVIAQKMLASTQHTASVTLTTQADAANLMGVRKQFKNAGDPIIPSYNDIIMKLTCSVLQRHPIMASRLREDEILVPSADQFNLGIAVDTDQGLLVPVIPNVANKSLMQVAEASLVLIERARQGKIKLEQLQGGVFTISNLGPFGIDAFTPIINLPEAAILGIGAIRREAVVQSDDKIVPGSRLTLSLTFDHRLVDGAPASRFLAEIRESIENPVPHLLTR